MIEIKYLKDLPCKLLNNSSLIGLVGGDIYVDADGYRYIFLGFRNNTKKPIFDLYLEIKQYDGSGTLITSKKFCLPNIYFPKGDYITEEPIKVEKECNGCEINITYADFGTHILADDLFERKMRESRSPKYGRIDQKPVFGNKVEPVVEEKAEEPEITVAADEKPQPTPVAQPAEPAEPTEETPVVKDVVKGKTKISQIGKYRGLFIGISIFVAVAVVGVLFWFLAMWAGPKFDGYYRNIIEIIQNFEF